MRSNLVGCMGRRHLDTEAGDLANNARFRSHRVIVRCGSDLCLWNWSFPTCLQSWQQLALHKEQHKETLEIWKQAALQAKMTQMWAAAAAATLEDVLEQANQVGHATSPSVREELVMATQIQVTYRMHRCRQEFLLPQRQQRRTTATTSLRRSCSEITMSTFNDSRHDDGDFSLDTTSSHRLESTSYFHPHESASLHRLLHLSRIESEDDAFESVVLLGDICECPRANMERNNQSLSSVVNSKWNPECSNSSILPPVSPMRQRQAMNVFDFSPSSFSMSPQEEMKLTGTTGSNF